MQKYQLETIPVNGVRHYKVSETEFYPSVTTILSATKPAKDRVALANWKARMGAEAAEQISRNACDRGTRFHSVVENFIKSNDWVDPFVPGYLRETWDNSKKLLYLFKQHCTVNLIESTVWSSHGYAGTVDCVYSRDGELKILDWKTASKPKKAEWITDYFLQLAAYREAIAEMYGVKLNEGLVIIFLPDESPQVFTKTEEQLDSYFEVFMERLKEYKANN